MAKPKKSNLKEEKWLAEELQKIPSLYDKGNEGYRNRTYSFGWRMHAATTKLDRLSHKGTLDMFF